MKKRCYQCHKRPPVRDRLCGQCHHQQTAFDREIGRQEAAQFGRLAGWFGNGLMPIPNGRRASLTVNP